MHIASKAMKPAILIAAAAMSGAVTIPMYSAPIAHAACQDWVLGPANLILHQDNGIEVDIYGWTGKAITNLPSGAPAYAQYWSNGTKTKGSATGNLNGNVVEMNLTWNDGPGAGLSNYYYATIADDGTVFGTTTNSQNAQNGFSSETKAKCNDGAAPAKPADPNPGGTGGGTPDTPAKQTVTVQKESSVYAVPGGAETPGISLGVGRTYTIVKPCDPNWCLLTIPELQQQLEGLPAHQGWVYSGIQDGDPWLTVG